MTAEEKAQELVGKFKDYVHGYIGSSMLTNYEYPEQIKSQAKKLSIEVVDEIISECSNWAGGSMDNGWDAKRFDYWNEVKSFIEAL